MPHHLVLGFAYFTYATAAAVAVAATGAQRHWCSHACCCCWADSDDEKLKGVHKEQRFVVCGDMTVTLIAFYGGDDEWCAPGDMAKREVCFYSD